MCEHSTHIHSHYVQLVEPDKIGHSRQVLFIGCILYIDISWPGCVKIILILSSNQQVKCRCSEHTYLKLFEYSTSNSILKTKTSFYYNFSNKLTTLYQSKFILVLKVDGQ